MGFFNPPTTFNQIITALGYTPVNKAGDTMTGNLSAPTIVATSNFTTSPLGFYSFDSNTNDTRLTKGASGGIIEQRNGVNAQSYYVYNTYTDASNFERLSAFWAANSGRVLTESAGTGLPRDLILGTQGAASLLLRTNGLDRWKMDSNGNFITNADNAYDIGASGANRPRNIYVGTSLTAAISIRTVPLTVAALPAAASAGAGSKAYVTDATATLTAGIGAIVTGGGVNIVPVGSDGTNWRIGG